MLRFQVLLLAAVTASPPVVAGPDSGRVVQGAKSSEAGASRQEEAYLLKRGTEVAMLWSAVTRRPFSAERIACDYLVERNFEREQPLVVDAEYGCGGIDEFTRRDRVVAAVPKIQAEYDALAKRKELRVLLTVPMQEYDFSRKGFATGLADNVDARFAFHPLSEDCYLLLENAGRLGFIALDEPRARAVQGGPFWLFELTIRPTGFREKPFTRASTLKQIKARIVSARLYTSAEGSFDPGPSVMARANAQDQVPVVELRLDAGAPSRTPKAPARPPSR